ncbi:MAG: hypothetical protein ACXW6T_25105 [Candidatus Binatia bacterium]
MFKFIGECSIKFDCVPQFLTVRFISQGCRNRSLSGEEPVFVMPVKTGIHLRFLNRRGGYMKSGFRPPPE